MRTFYLIDIRPSRAFALISVIRKHMPSHYAFQPACVVEGDRVLDWDAALWEYNPELQGVERMVGLAEFTEITKFRNGEVIDSYAVSERALNSP